jgi:hypothetical protein
VRKGRAEGVSTTAASRLMFPTIADEAESSDNEPWRLRLHNPLQRVAFKIHSFIVRPAIDEMGPQRGTKSQ